MPHIYVSWCFQFHLSVYNIWPVSFCYCWCFRCFQLGPCLFPCPTPPLGLMLHFVLWRQKADNLNALGKLFLGKLVWLCIFKHFQNILGIIQLPWMQHALPIFLTIGQNHCLAWLINYSSHHSPSHYESDDLCWSFCTTSRQNWMLYARLLVMNRPLLSKLSLNKFTFTNPTLINDIIQNSNSSSWQLSYTHNPFETLCFCNFCSYLTLCKYLLSLPLFQSHSKQLLLLLFLKKPNLDPADFTNYHPLSNFKKLWKRFDIFQSGFHSHHSTATDLVKGFQLSFWWLR